MTKANLLHAGSAIKLLATVCLLSLTACGASSGTLVKPQQLSSFATGETTYDQVVACLGNPTTVNTSTDGTRTASYTHASVQARPESYIPLVGGFVGGADSTSHTVNLVFDRNSILKKIDTQDTAISSNTM